MKKKTSKILLKSPLVKWFLGCYLFMEFIGVYFLQFIMQGSSSDFYKHLTSTLPALEAVGFFSGYSIARAIQYSLLFFMVVIGYPCLAVYELAKHMSLHCNEEVIKWAKESSKLRKLKTLGGIFGMTILYYFMMLFILFVGETAGSISQHSDSLPKSFVAWGDGIVAIFWQNLIGLSGFILIYWCIVLTYAIIRYSEKRGEG